MTRVCVRGRRYSYTFCGHGTTAIFLGQQQDGGVRGHADERMADIILRMIEPHTLGGRKHAKGKRLNLEECNGSLSFV